MQKIYLHHPYDKTQIINEPIVMALGFFDGVHLGHQRVIKTAIDEARLRGIKVAVMTFSQHPKIVYQKLDPKEMTYLSTNERKEELFEQLGIDIMYMIDYTYDFGMQSPQTFVDDYIVAFNVEVIVAGFDYTYGKREVANMQTLPEHAKGRFEIIEIPELILHQKKVGSSNIKDLIETGEIETANEELGYIYQTSGVVIHGDKRGRLLGYPTANILTDDLELIPAVGVYVVEIEVGDHWYQGMASIGYNITFEANRKMSCEVYILDFNQTIYGEKVKIKWHHYLRPELKFASTDDLIHQLDEDLIDTRAYFATLGG
ncbi:riboflavin biosynthesis protein RibF [Fundicoccus culcitae]|uniref:Riboflavin biosynthesis protein n=1 Tax=Fundicoccus culcitae TaxID=2969821 RepID=A0ABY5P7P3_9LACT|nr:riboflavin biosynthesis protein RibF [Fundicoccus culcitae]UUX34621.1 riboflavin biosynthesis protein RibF [Fundicoccus culcitae]